jgi:hypothetical protein
MMVLECDIWVDDSITIWRANKYQVILNLPLQAVNAAKGKVFE